MLVLLVLRSRWLPPRWPSGPPLKLRGEGGNQMETVSSSCIRAMDMCHLFDQRDLTVHGENEKAAGIGTTDPYAEAEGIY